MKKIVIALLGLTLLTGFSFGQVSEFDVSVGKSPTQTNEPVDLTIKALNSNGDVVEDYESDVLIELYDQDGNIADEYVTYPNDGFYTFTAEDQGTKTFSKGLIVRKDGEYDIQVSDLIDSDIKGEESIVLNKEGEDDINGTINISSPTEGSEEKDLPINVIAKTNISNSPYEIYVDGNKNKEGMTDENGQVNDTVNNLKEGEHKLQIKILNSNEEEVASSKDVTFSYKPSSNDLYKSIELLPSNTVNKEDIISIKVNTSNNVQSATVELVGLSSYPMDEVEDGIFKKEIALDKAGQYSIKATLSDGTNSKSYEDLETITVKELVSIENIKYSIKGESDLVIEWKSKGDINSYRVNYGNQKNNLKTTKNVEEEKLTIEDFSPEEDFFVKVTPLDSSSSPKGEASDVVSVDVQSKTHKSAPTCAVKNIKLSTKKEGDKYYLTWGEVDSVEKYMIYKSDEYFSSIEDMQKVGETENNQFEYPFDPEAEKLKYRNYAVVAECKEGNSKQVDSIKKVKVGPMDTAMLFTLIAFIAYGFYRMYSFTRD